jgi:hypothetical protein
MLILYEGGLNENSISGNEGRNMKCCFAVVGGSGHVEYVEK